MINKQTIKKMSHSTTYQRGLQLYRTGAVVDCDINTYIDELGDEIAEIRAQAEGSSYNDYAVEITVNESASGIVDTYCECPAFENYEGFCKHCVAVLLEYLEKRPAILSEKEEEGLEQLFQLLGATRGKNIRNQEGWKRQTSEKLKKVLSQYSLRENAAFLPETRQGQVHLEPCVMYDGFGRFSVKFKIGITQMYVLKNIPKFIGDLEEMNTVFYGKKLEFLHCLEAFDAESRPLAEFLMTTKDTRSYQYFSSFHVQYPGENRELLLEEQRLDHFMECMEGRAFYVEPGNDWSGEKSGMYRICRENPMELLKLTGDEDGITLQSDLMDRVMGQEYCYYIRQAVPAEEKIIYKAAKAEVEEIDAFLEYLYHEGREEMFIGQEELPVFCRTLLPVLQKHFRIQYENFQPENYLPQEVTFEIYLDAPQKDMIVCKLLGCYGEKKYNLFQSDALRAGEQGRDVRRESQAKSLVGQFFYAYDAATESMAMQGEEDIYRFLTKGMDVLKELGEVFVSEELKRITVVSKVKIQVGVSLSGSLLKMQLDSEQFTREQLADILSRYEKKKKYYRLKTGEFVRMDEEGIQVLDDLKENFQLTDKQMRQEEIVIPKYRALYLDGRLKGEGFQIKKSREFKQLIKDMKNVEDNDFEFPESLADTLREYQKMGFLWMKTLCKAQFGGILADDMGLGKTLQTIAFLLSEYQEAGEGAKKRTLIVTPASLVYNWKSEFEKFAPELPVYTVTGSVRDREELLQRWTDRSDQQEQQSERAVLITSYQLLYRDEELYEKIKFDYQIIDEAQMIKNQGNQTTKAVKDVQAEFRLALTGTPLENRLSELWSIFDFVMPGFLYKYQRFRKEIEMPIVKSQDEEVMKRLQKTIQPFVLRRTKQEVLKELPEKMERCMYARLEGEQKNLYQAHAQRLQMQLARQSEEEFKTSKIKILSELTRLRQLCCDPALFYGDYKDSSAKLELCIDLIENAVESGHKMLLFSQFTGMLDRITAKLKEKKISFYLLTGKTPKEDRIRMVNQFNGDGTSVFCISLKAGGTGLNLTGADMVIHYDPWWNAAVETQATDRAHRIGQKQSVTVYKLIAKHTIEEKIVELQSKKKELASQVLGGEGIDQASFSREELLKLLED